MSKGLLGMEDIQDITAIDLDLGLFQIRTTEDVIDVDGFVQVVKVIDGANLDVDIASVDDAVTTSAIQAFEVATINLSFGAAHRTVDAAHIDAFNLRVVAAIQDGMSLTDHGAVGRIATSAENEILVVTNSRIVGQRLREWVVLDIQPSVATDDAR